MSRPSKPHLHRGKWRTRIDGREIDLGTDERKARIEFHQLMAAALAEPGDRPDTVQGAAVAWLALHQQAVYIDWLRPLKIYAGDTYLTDVGRDFLTRFHIHLRTLKARKPVYDKATKAWRSEPSDHLLAPKTVQHCFRTAVRVLRWAHGAGWLRTMPDVPKLARPVRKARDVQPEQLAATFSDLPKNAAPILRFIVATGCRPSEACRLEWKDVRLDARVCILNEHKTADATGETRRIQLTPQAADVLRGMKPCIGPVFLNRLGRAYKPSGLRSILRRRGISGGYRLRHTFAQTASETMPEEVLAALMGHSDPRTTKHYYEVRNARAQAAAATIRLPIDPTPKADAG